MYAVAREATKAMVLFAEIPMNVNYPSQTTAMKARCVQIQRAPMSVDVMKDTQEMEHFVKILMSVNEQRRTSVTPTPYALTLKASIYAAV